MHHADAKTVGVVGVMNLDDLAVFQNFTLFRLVHAKQYAHQRRLASAVFSQKRMDLAFFELQRNIIVGHNPGENFGNMAHFNDIFAHPVSLLSV